jgi:hypothetical protein
LSRRRRVYDQRHPIALTRHNERQGAPSDLTSDNNDLALAGLFLGKPAVFAIGLSVLRLDVSAEIGSIDLNLAAQFRLVWIVNLRAHRFAQLVQQHESAFRVNVQIAADL